MELFTSRQECLDCDGTGEVEISESLEFQNIGRERWGPTIDDCGSVWDGSVESCEGINPGESVYRWTLAKEFYKKIKENVGVTEDLEDLRQEIRISQLHRQCGKTIAVVGKTAEKHPELKEHYEALVDYFYGTTVGDDCSPVWDGSVDIPDSLASKSAHAHRLSPVQRYLQSMRPDMWAETTEELYKKILESVAISEDVSLSVESTPYSSGDENKIKKMWDESSKPWEIILGRDGTKSKVLYEGEELDDVESVHISCRAADGTYAYVNVEHTVSVTDANWRSSWFILEGDIVSPSVFYRGKQLLGLYLDSVRFHSPFEGAFSISLKIPFDNMKVVWNDE